MLKSGNGSNGARNFYVAGKQRAVLQKGNVREEGRLLVLLQSHQQVRSDARHRAE
jgi:hypothetical protein